MSLFPLQMLSRHAQMCSKCNINHRIKTNVIPETEQARKQTRSTLQRDHSSRDSAQKFAIATSTTGARHATAGNGVNAGQAIVRHPTNSRPSLPAPVRRLPVHRSPFLK